MIASATRLMRELGDFGHAFLTWWLAELSALNPIASRLRLLTRNQRVRIDMAGQRVAIHHETGGQDRLLGTLDLGEGEGQSADPLGLLARAGLSQRITRGQLPLCLRLTGARPLPVPLSLPLAAEENLREAVSFELDRSIPLRLSDIYFGFDITSRDTRHRRMDVLVVAARRTAVDAALATLGSVGLRPTRVELVGDGETEIPPCDVLPSGMTTPGRNVPSRRVVMGLWAVAISLAIVAVALPIRQLDRAEYTLTRGIAETKRAAEDVQRLRKEIATFDEASRFLVNRKYGMPGMSMILSEIARVLPDDTWLLEMQITLPEVQIGGHSQRAAALIGLLEQSRFFRGSEFRSPTTRDSRTGRENFSIATKVQTEDQP